MLFEVPASPTPDSDGAMISLDARMLAIRLGLGDLVRSRPCHGFQFGCRCRECKDRERNGLKPKPAAKQPWEIAA